MELKMQEYHLPECVLFNYEELKAELSEKVKNYEATVYTEDQIQSAKADRANLNKLKKALNDERIRREKEYMQPFLDFKNKVGEIIVLIDKPINAIDKQIKGYEEKKKEEKLKKIQEHFESVSGTDFHWLRLPAIFSEKWLNASVSMKSIQEEIAARLGQIAKDITTLSELPEFALEAVETYKVTLDMTSALNEAHRLSDMAKRKAEMDAEKARRAEEAKSAAEAKVETKPAEEPKPAVFEAAAPAEPEKQWVSFAALISTEDAYALRDFFISRKIEFKAI